MISKFAPKRKTQLIDRTAIKEELKLIDVTDDYYITPSGKIYRKYGNKYYPRKNYVNKRNGYVYTTIVERNGQKRTYRVHRLVAVAYLPNPNKLQIVGHKDNIKSNCDVSNLYWTTNAENIQKAVDDNLLINKKGYEDSQSHPVIVYDRNFKEVNRYGSISECHNKLGVSKSTISRHCTGTIKTATRCGYYFRYQSA